MVFILKFVQNLLSTEDQDQDSQEEEGATNTTSATKFPSADIREKFKPKLKKSPP